MTGIVAALAGVLALLGYVFGLKRKASRERDARVRAEIARDQARGEADVAKAQAAVVERVDAQQADAREVARERATDPAVVNAPTPAAQVDAALDGLRKQRAAAKVRAASAKKAGWK